MKFIKLINTFSPYKMYKIHLWISYVALNWPIKYSLCIIWYRFGNHIASCHWEKKLWHEYFFIQIITHQWTYYKKSYQTLAYWFYNIVHSLVVDKSTREVIKIFFIFCIFYRVFWFRIDGSLHVILWLLCGEI